MRYTKLERLFYRWTLRRWNRLISHALSMAYERRIINSAQMHALAAEFDPTQELNIVNRMLPRYQAPGYDVYLPETVMRQQACSRNLNL